MKAMILAAGRGNRMRPLTDKMPKPLLRIKNKPLIVYHIEHLVTAGFADIVINTAWLGKKIVQTLGNGSQWQANISYSHEYQALGTGGGIGQALTQLTEHEERFIVVNGDVWCNFPFVSLRDKLLKSEDKAHLVLVPNPDHHPQGDFTCRKSRVERLAVDNNQTDKNSHTFSGISVLSKTLFKDQPEASYDLPDLLHHAVEHRQVSGEIYHGEWMDIGTPQRLKQLSAQFD